MDLVKFRKRGYLVASCEIREYQNDAMEVDLESVRLEGIA
jgi:hypothetical protein